MNKENKGSSTFILFTVLLSAIFNFSFLEYNNFLIRKHNPDNIERNARALVHGHTVFSVDNEYYLTPVSNYIGGKGWKRSPGVSDGDYFRRVPGYSAVYLFFVKIFGEPEAHRFIRFFQLLLFLFTIPVIFYLARQLAGINPAKLVTIVYAFIPFISSWAYYTLTESISPALNIFYIFFLVRAVHSETDKAKLKNYLAASLFFTFGVLTRPYIAIAGLPLFIFTLKDYLFQKPGKATVSFALIWMVPLFFIGAWTARNYSLTGEFVPLEKSVHPQTLDRMKPDFRGFWRFAKCWGEDGSVMNTYHDPLYFSALRGDTSPAHITNILKAWPPEIIKQFGEERLSVVLEKYQLATLEMKPYADSVKAMPDKFLAGQLAVEKEFDKLTAEYKKKNFFSYWVKSPLVYLKRMVANSNTSHLFFFQEENRGKAYVNAFRYGLLFIHVFLYLSLLLNFFIMKGPANRMIFVYMPLLFILFFTCIHREIEQRYMLPVLPVLVAGSAIIIGRISGLFRKTSSV